MFTELEYVKF